MIAFKGRLSFCQYLPAKPTKYGIKVWMAADSQNGYVNNFSVYLGKKGNVPRANVLGYDVVMKMASPFLKKHRHISFDNYFFYEREADGRSASSKHLCLQHSLIQSKRLAAMCKEETAAGGKSMRSARQNNFYQVARQKRHFVLVHKCFA